MPMNINLSEHGDRVVSLVITDKYGEVYYVNMEFLNHDFESDEVQISCHKMPKKHDISPCPIYGPNRILHAEKPVDLRGPDHYVNASVWWEFHSVGNLPAVKS